MSNICFDCKRAIGHCPWSKNAQPIPGWVATKVPRDGPGGAQNFTYDIRKCPLFIPDPVNTKCKKEIRNGRV